MVETTNVKGQVARARKKAVVVRAKAQPGLIDEIVIKLPRHARTANRQKTATEILQGVRDAVHLRTSSFLGGSKFWPSKPESPTAVHEAVMRGVPFGSLNHLVGHVTIIRQGDVAKVLGMSHKTLTRQAQTPKKTMPADLASKTWQFAEILAKASEVFGGETAGETWMSTPAVALNGARPIDMLQTLQGSEVVRDYLTRLEFGVYA